MRGESKSLAVVPAKKSSVWQRRIARWEHSGRTQREFCRERRFALSTFQWWRARLRRSEPAAAPAFVPIALGTSDTGAVEITLRSNTRVRVQGAAASRVVDALIARLK